MSEKYYIDESDEIQIDSNAKPAAENANKSSDNRIVCITVPNMGKDERYFRTQIAGKKYNFALSLITIDGEDTNDPVTIRMTKKYFDHREKNEFSRIKCMVKPDYTDKNRNPLYSRENIYYREKI